MFAIDGREGAMVNGLVVLSAYLIGTIPWSYLLPWAAGYDIRQLGDGNVGAHNVMHHAGRTIGLLALVLDAGKGAGAVLLAGWLGGSPWLMVVAGWMAVLGHNYPVWLRFRGGKGLATGLGVVLALLPGLSWLTLAGSMLLIALTRNLAFAGACMSLTICAAAAWYGYGLAHVLAPLGILVLMGWKQLPELWRMWHDAPDKRDLILNRWIRDRKAKL